MRDPDFSIPDTLLAPDFPGGGHIIYDRKAMEAIYKTGRGSIRIRSRYAYDASANCIDVTQIPPTTTAEGIVEKIVELIRQGKLKEVADVRDETGLEGLKITIDLKRGTDPEKLMQKLFRMTPLEDTFSCNFNVLVAGVPRVMGVKELLEEWIAFRIECVRRRTHYDMNRKAEKLHLLKGLKAILLDIDKAVKIVRETDEEAEVVPNLMNGFGIDKEQAEYVAEIRLRHLNREYILKRTEEISKLEEEISRLKEILESKTKVKSIIISELQQVSREYGQPRKSMLLYASELPQVEEEDETPDYPVNLFFTREGYFKKITPLSLRMSGEHKLKEGDEIVQQIEGTNAMELLFFTDRCQVYKAKVSDFADTKASVMGDYIPARLSMDEGENAQYMVALKKYSGYMLFFFENGKAAKVDMAAYETKTNRKKLVGAYSDKSSVVAMYYIPEDGEFLLTNAQGRILLVHSGAIAAKSTRSTQGVQVMTLRKNGRVVKVELYEEGRLKNPSRYRKNIPASGSLPAAEETEGDQMTL